MPDEYSILESGGSVNFSVLVLSGTLDVNVIVEFYTGSGSAVGMYCLEDLSVLTCSARI